MKYDKSLTNYHIIEKIIELLKYVHIECKKQNIEYEFYIKAYHNSKNLAIFYDYITFHFSKKNIIYFFIKIKNERNVYNNNSDLDGSYISYTDFIFYKNLKLLLSHIKNTSWGQDIFWDIETIKKDKQEYSICHTYFNKNKQKFEMPRTYSSLLDPFQLVSSVFSLDVLNKTDTININKLDCNLEYRLTISVSDILFRFLILNLKNIK